MHRNLALAVLLGLTVAGCGGGEQPDPDRAAVLRVLGELDRAQQEGDAEKACAELFVVEEPYERAAETGTTAGAAKAGGDEAAERGRPAAGEREREAGGAGEAGVGRESPAACRAAFTQGLASRREQVRSIDTKVERVAAAGDRATARVRATVVRTDGSRFSTVFTRYLVRRDGRWRVSITPES